MKKLIILFSFLPQLLFAEEFKSPSDIVLANSELDASLSGEQAIFEFKFFNFHPSLPDETVYYSIDGKNGTQVSKNGLITLPSSQGKHIFQFYYSDQYLEIYSDSLEIKARHRDRYNVTLTHSGQREMLLKPVIYLYPKLTTDVSVHIDIHGEDPFLYPTYTDAWKFTAHPNGELVFEDKTFNYLFWEATSAKTLTPEKTASGFFIKGENAVSFLEEKLTSAGFNSKEQADFITFWGPQMAKHELNFVHFVFNDACDQYAELNISPKPNKIYRIFMVWGEVSEAFEVEEQEIKQIDRTGFSVLEWGGQETTIEQHFYNKNS